MKEDKTPRLDYPEVIPEKRKTHIYKRSRFRFPASILSCFFVLLHTFLFAIMNRIANDRYLMLLISSIGLGALVWLAKEHLFGTISDRRAIPSNTTSTKKASDAEDPTDFVQKMKKQV